MEFTARFLGSFAGAAGVGTAVGVPVAMKVNSTTGDFNANLQENNIFKVSISECLLPSVDSKTKIDFGNSQEGSVCWKVKSDEERALENLQDYTHFFQGRGDLKDTETDVKNYQDHGKGECNHPQSQGVINSLNLDNKTKYLGLCGSTSVENTKFVKTTKEENKTTLSICDKNCGQSERETSSAVSSKFVGKEINSGSGKIVEFFKDTVRE